MRKRQKGVVHLNVPERMALMALVAIINDGRSDSDPIKLPVVLAMRRDDGYEGTLNEVQFKIPGGFVNVFLSRTPHDDPGGMWGVIGFDEFKNNKDGKSMRHVRRCDNLEKLLRVHPGIPVPPKEVKISDGLTE